MAKPITCLLIDDDPDELVFVKYAFSKIDSAINCMQSSDGQTAIRLCERLNYLPSFILLDLNLPRMSGGEVLEYLKTNKRLKDIPVIIYSNSIDTKTESNLVSLGASDFIIKPHSFSVLIPMLKRIWQKYCA